ncbi:MAG: AAA family ATPase [Caldilineaceae bacterium]
MLCFVGPPGVGKTSLGISIARAMNRKFVRAWPWAACALRPTSAASGAPTSAPCPGASSKACVALRAKTPVFMLDKWTNGSDFAATRPARAAGSAGSGAEPGVQDHYLDVSFDLSQVMFITTAKCAGHDPGAPARPHGDHRTEQLHRSLRRSPSPRAI